MAPFIIVELVALIAPVITFIVKVITSTTLYLSALFYSLPEVVILITETLFSFQVGLTMTSLYPNTIPDVFRLYLTLKIALLFYLKKLVNIFNNSTIFLAFRLSECGKIG